VDIIQSFIYLPTYLARRQERRESREGRYVGKKEEQKQGRLVEKKSTHLSTVDKHDFSQLPREFPPQFHKRSSNKLGTLK
jgi:hypothetical protein